MEAQARNPDVSRAMAFQRIWRRILPCLSPCSSWLPKVLGVPRLSNTSLQSLPLLSQMGVLLFVCLCLNFPFLIRIPVIGLRTTLIYYVCMCVQSLSHVWLFVIPIDYSLPGFSVHGILQARVLEWVVISFSKGIFLTEGSNLFLSRWPPLNLTIKTLLPNEDTFIGTRS